MSSILGNNIPNKNNMLRCKNVHRFGDQYRVMKFINGKQRHIRCFDSFDDAKACATKMNEYNMNDENERQEFISWVNDTFLGKKGDYTC